MSLKQLDIRAAKTCWEPTSHEHMHWFMDTKDSRVSSVCCQRDCIEKILYTLFGGVFYLGKLLYSEHHMMRFNSSAMGNLNGNFRHVIFKQIFVIDGWGISCEIALIWMSLDFTDDQSTLVQVMAWCRQATSHYLSQCWPRSLSPNGVTKAQWVLISNIKSNISGTNDVSGRLNVELSCP